MRQFIPVHRNQSEIPEAPENLEIIRGVEIICVLKSMDNSNELWYGE